MDLVNIHKERSSKLDQAFTSSLNKQTKNHIDLQFESYSQRLQKMPERKQSHVLFKIAELFFQAEDELYQAQEIQQRNSNIIQQGQSNMNMQFHQQAACNYPPDMTRNLPERTAMHTQQMSSICQTGSLFTDVLNM